VYGPCGSCQGFWTYIKYTIVEQHVYKATELSKLPWRDQASIAFGFFQMVGFNHYEDTAAGTETMDYIR
jgi:hypothetical protein